MGKKKPQQNPFTAAHWVLYVSSSAHISKGMDMGSRRLPTYFKQQEK